MNEELSREFSNVNRASLSLRMRAVNDQAVRIIRLLEKRLVEALDGTPLHGCYNLAPVGRFVGYSVRGGFHGHETWVRESPSLVLGKDGYLLMVNATPSGEFYFEKVRDSELVPADVRPVVSAVIAACRRHVDRIELRSAKRDVVSELVERLEKALGG